MTVSILVVDSTYPNGTYAGAFDEFTGSFIATHDLFQFSYAYDYSIGSDCDLFGGEVTYLIMESVHG